MVPFCWQIRAAAAAIRLWLRDAMARATLTPISLTGWKWLSSSKVRINPMDSKITSRLRMNWAGLAPKGAMTMAPPANHTLITYWLRSLSIITRICRICLIRGTVSTITSRRGGVNVPPRPRLSAFEARAERKNLRLFTDLMALGLLKSVLNRRPMGRKV